MWLLVKEVPTTQDHDKEIWGGEITAIGLSVPSMLEKAANKNRNIHLN